LKRPDKNYEHHLLDYFGSGKEQAKNFGTRCLRQALLNNFLSKDIDQYGLLTLTKNLVTRLLDNPYSIRFVMNQGY
jgi:ATP-dependent DNA helicase RecQ